MADGPDRSRPGSFDASAITLSGIIHNLVPVTLGNIVGGAGLVGAMYWAIYRAAFGESGRSSAPRGKELYLARSNRFEVWPYGHSFQTTGEIPMPLQTADWEPNKGLPGAKGPRFSNSSPRSEPTGLKSTSLHGAKGS